MEILSLMFIPALAALSLLSKAIIGDMNAKDSGYIDEFKDVQG